MAARLVVVVVAVVVVVVVVVVAAAVGAVVAVLGDTRVVDDATAVSLVLGARVELA